MKKSKKTTTLSKQLSLVDAHFRSSYFIILFLIVLALVIGFIGGYGDGWKDAKMKRQRINIEKKSGRVFNNLETSVVMGKDVSYEGSTRY